MPDITLKYPLDTTGTNSANKVQGESHALNGRSIRAILPDYGVYFAKSMKVVDTDTGTTLTPGVQWRPGEMQVDLTAMYGKEISRVILITDNAINGPVVLEYQALGGEASVSNRAMQELIDSIDLDGEAVDYNNIIGLPERFNPKPHNQHSITLYGAGRLLDSIKNLKYAISVGNSAAVKELYALSLIHI